MAGRLNAVVIAPMGGKKAEEKKSEESEGSEDESGLRDAFEEYADAMEAGDRDAAFEALKNFTDMCAMKSMDGDY